MKTLTDEKVFPNPKFKKPTNFQDRETVRIIIKNTKDEIAFVTNPIHKFLILPGGGAESADLKKEAKREALEEISYHIDIVKEIGKIEEFRNRNNKHYLTTYFLATTKEEGEEDLRTGEEKGNGLEVRWLTLEKARGILNNQTEQVKKGEVKFYNTAFNIVRDNYFIQLI